MKKEGWDFPQALKYLAERAGVRLEPQTPETEQAAEEHERLRTLLEEAVTFYRHQPAKPRPGSRRWPTCTNASSRDATIETFGLGYAPDAWEAALQHFQSKGYQPEELLQAGLATQRDCGRRATTASATASCSRSAR